MTVANLPDFMLFKKGLINMDSLFNYHKWPWEEKSKKLPEPYRNNKDWPKLSIVIPSYNQGSFIEETILSVIRQNYPNLELIIIDGGSEDNTLSIIKKYESFIHHWVSEKDRGQSNAINKGFKVATGDWIGWINSDDCYLENALHQLFLNPQINSFDFIYGDKGYTGENLNTCREYNAGKIYPLRLKNVLRFFSNVDHIIPSQSIFISRNLLNQIGLLNENLHYCMDMEFFARIAIVKPRIYFNRTRSFFYRTGEHTKTQSYPDKMFEEAIQVACAFSSSLNLFDKISLHYLIAYIRQYNSAIKMPKARVLLKLILLFPFHALMDKRVLGLIKRKLFKRYRE